MKREGSCEEVGVRWNVKAISSFEATSTFILHPSKKVSTLGVKMVGFE